VMNRAALVELLGLMFALVVLVVLLVLFGF
jgi:hypothetical protein